MPKIIRNALFYKVSHLQELRRFQDDFTLISGLSVAFVNDLGVPDGLPLALAPLCRHIQKCPSGEGFCRGVRQRLLADARDRPACTTCDAGLWEGAVPVRISGVVAGFLVFVGTVDREFTGPSLRRVEHLLGRVGVDMKEAKLEALIAGSKIVPPELFHAYLRLVDNAARQIAGRMTTNLDQGGKTQPLLVERACRAIRRRALVEDISLDDVAAECGVSPSHLSRMFHQGAGITFREYIARWRAEQAEHLLLSTHHPITRIAYESGFQSLSQFNRVFRAIYGESPRSWRGRARRLAAADNHGVI